MLEHPGTRRDAEKFVAAVWPSRPPEARFRFETMALDESRLAGEDELARWHSILGRIVKAVPEETLQSERLVALRRATAEKTRAQLATWLDSASA